MATNALSITIDNAFVAIHTTSTEIMLVKWS
jgi:hypothetical protein